MMKLRIEHLFDDADSRLEGMQDRTMGKGECAVFVYDESLPRSFWMKDVPMDLYISAIVNGKCASCELMGANTTDPHKVPAAFLYVESRVGLPVGAEVSIEGGWLVV